jgi:hypothetical protein
VLREPHLELDPGLAEGHAVAGLQPRRGHPLAVHPHPALGPKVDDLELARGLMLQDRVEPCDHGRPAISGGLPASAC